MDKNFISTQCCLYQDLFDFICLLFLFCFPIFQPVHFNWSTFNVFSLSHTLTLSLSLSFSHFSHSCSLSPSYYHTLSFIYFCLSLLIDLALPSTLSPLFLSLTISLSLSSLSFCLFLLLSIVLFISISLFNIFFSFFLSYLYFCIRKFIGYKIDSVDIFFLHLTFFVFQFSLSILRSTDSINNFVNLIQSFPNYGFLMFNDLFSPLIFTVVKLKSRPAINSSVSYDLGSCPFISASFVW